MVFYPASKLVAELWAIIDGIPNEWEHNFVESLWSKIPLPPLSIAQYNRLLDLYNKYILVPSCPRQQYSERHYGS